MTRAFNLRWVQASVPEAALPQRQTVALGPHCETESRPALACGSARVATNAPSHGDVCTNSTRGLIVQGRAPTVNRRARLRELWPAEQLGQARRQVGTDALGVGRKERSDRNAILPTAPDGLLRKCSNRLGFSSASRLWSVSSLPSLSTCHPALIYADTQMAARVGAAGVKSNVGSSPFQWLSGRRPGASRWIDERLTRPRHQCLPSHARRKCPTQRL